VELARQMFPSASQILQTRLGRANWKRKVVLKVAHEQNRRIGSNSKTKGSKGPNRTARQEVAQDAFNFQKPTLRDAGRSPRIGPAIPLPSVSSSSAKSGPASDTSSGQKLSRIGSSTTLTTFSSMVLSAKAAANSGKAAGVPTQGLGMHPFVMQLPQIP